MISALNAPVCHSQAGQACFPEFRMANDSGGIASVKMYLSYKKMNQFEQQCGRLQWVSWRYPAGHFESLKTVDPPIPCRHGVYVIRAPQLIPRVQGRSNVVYIGQSGGGQRAGKQGIGPGNGGPGRLFNTRGFEEVVRTKIEDLFPGSDFILECAFVVDPLQVEADLLQAYFEAHFELPPANHDKGVGVRS